jgi:hypothetical protein
LPGFFLVLVAGVVLAGGVDAAVFFVCKEARPAVGAGFTFVASGVFVAPGFLAASDARAAAGAFASR